VVLVAHEFFQVERRGVVKKLAGLAEQKRFGVHLGGGALSQLGQHGNFGCFQDAIETAQHRERQDDLAIFGLLVIAAQEISDGPDEGGKIGVAHAGWFSGNGSEPVATGVDGRQVIILAKKRCARMRDAARVKFSARVHAAKVMAK
jgi:hypothetical protein